MVEPADPRAMSCSVLVGHVDDRRRKRLYDNSLLQCSNTPLKIKSHIPHFRAPVRQTQGQIFDVRITGSKLIFDYRDLLPAALDSRRLLLPFLSDVLERTVVTVKGCLLS